MRTAALISIHPEHLANILAGTKTFEYRRTLPRRDISLLALYGTAPEKSLVAIAEVLDQIVAPRDDLWKRTASGAGISYKFFCDYFAGRKEASAIRLGKVHEFSRPIGLDELPKNRVPPQSFFYLDDEELAFLDTFLDEDDLSESPR